MRRYIDVLCFSLLQSVQRQMEYPSFLFAWLLMIPLQSFSGILVIGVLVGKFGDLAGWSYPEVCFLFGLSLISHGLQVTLFIPTWMVDGAISDALFDRLKVRPMNVLFQFLCRHFNLIGCIDLFPAFTVFLYGAWKTAFPWTPLNILSVVAVVIAATLLRAGLYLGISSVAFWTTRSFSMVDISQQILMQANSYPMGIYPPVLQWVFTFLFPAALVAYYPASTLLGKTGSGILPVSGVLAAILGGLVVFFVGSAVFYRGLRAYRSTGS
jgi:ABC-2 type transport system permease protein